MQLLYEAFVEILNSSSFFIVAPSVSWVKRPDLWCVRSNPTGTGRPDGLLTVVAAGKEHFAIRLDGSVLVGATTTRAMQRAVRVVC